jgi:hypothetical protein
MFVNSPDVVTVHPPGGIFIISQKEKKTTKKAGIDRKGGLQNLGTPHPQRSFNWG